MEPELEVLEVAEKAVPCRQVTLVFSASSGTANTGGGGGGGKAYWSGTTYYGASGGSGICIIRWGY